MATLFEGKTALDNLIVSLNSNTNLNEAQTRFHIIDRILFNCLGWERELVEVEKCESNEFTDYELGSPRLPILEAKREGRTFEIPAGLSKKLITDLNSLIQISKEASNAIKQA